MTQLSITWEEPQGRIVYSDSVTCLCKIVLIFVGKSSPVWAAPFPTKGVLHCARVQASIHSSLPLTMEMVWLAIRSSCLDFSTMVDCNLELLTEISPFCPGFLSFQPMSSQEQKRSKQTANLKPWVLTELANKQQIFWHKIRSSLTVTARNGWRDHKGELRVGRGVGRGKERKA